jgi:aldose 1-epimerase
LDRTSQSGLRSELISSVYPKVVPVKVDHFSETLLCKSITEGEERQNLEKPVVQKTWKKMKESFGITSDGSEASLYTLGNAHGLVARITNYGGILVSLTVPDRHGKLSDVVLGFDTFEGYRNEHPCFGAIIGRYANRIASGLITLDGREYQLTQNDQENHLHGGLKGFDKVVWAATERESASGSALDLRYVSPDGEEGYPGNLTAQVTYSLTNENELKIDYAAVTDQTTVINLTNHSYFNLRDAGATDILGHELTIDADYFLAMDRSAIPTGEIRSVEGTPFDFRSPTAIGSRIGRDDPQLTYGEGYNHNWVLNNPRRTLAPVAVVCEPTSGRVMEVFTTAPGLQFFSGNFPGGRFGGKLGKPYPSRPGLCLEAQHYPDSPHHAGFPSTILRPGEIYSQTTIYRFR